MVNVLKFCRLVACLNSLFKQCRPRSDCFWRSSLIRVVPVCYSQHLFCKFQPWKRTFYLRTEREKCLKFLNIYFTVCTFYPEVSTKMRVLLYWCQALHIRNKDRYQNNERPRTLALLNSPTHNCILWYLHAPLFPYHWCRNVLSLLQMFVKFPHTCYNIVCIYKQIYRLICPIKWIH